MSEEEIEIHSALFRRVRHSIFSDGKFTYQIYYVGNGREQVSSSKDVDCIQIQDEKRLKKRLLKKIIQMNNSRIEKYKLDEEDKIYNNTPLELHEFQKVENNEGTSGYYSIYPKEFICNKCGKIFTIKKDEDLENMPLKCNISSCNGTIEQNTIVMYCENCGRIEPIDCRCKIHEQKYAHVKRPKSDSISTWSIYCSACEKTGEHIDFMRKKCICKSKRTPLPVREGGVISSVVMPFVDINNPSKGENSDYIRLGVHNSIFTNEKMLDLGLKINSKLSIGDNISALLEASNNSIYEISKMVENENQYINEKIEEIAHQYEGIDIESLNDFWSILEQSESYEKYISNLPSSESILYLEKCVEHKKKLKIEDIRLVEDLRVVTSSIGVIIGINKFYEDDFVPHFMPFKENKNEKSIYAISHPSKTEGILFQLDPIELCKWLNDNQFESCEPSSKDEALKYLQQLNDKSKEYEAVETLVHTFSHLLIKASSIYTGLDDTTCAELIFTRNASVLIYSTSNVNIGGFEYAFRYSMPNWLSKMFNHAEECTMDSVCINEGGACFICMYVTDFVCSNFNKNLSRQALIGGNKYVKGFWK